MINDQYKIKICFYFYLFCFFHCDLFFKPQRRINDKNLIKNPIHTNIIIDTHLLISK